VTEIANALSEILKMPMFDNMLVKLPPDADANELMPDPCCDRAAPYPAAPKNRTVRFFGLTDARVAQEGRDSPWGESRLD
jgi:hypothetical protein